MDARQRRSRGVAQFALHAGHDRSADEPDAYQPSGECVSHLALRAVCPTDCSLTTRRLPSGSLAISITLAVVGIWMLSDPGGAGFGLGEILGVACSILFSVNIVLINALLKHDTPAGWSAGRC